MAHTIPEHVSERVGRAFQARIRIGIVTAMDTLQAFVRRPGFTLADPVSYPFLDLLGTATPAFTVADEVLMIDATGAGGYIILGKVIHN